MSRLYYHRFSGRKYRRYPKKKNLLLRLSLILILLFAALLMVEKELSPIIINIAQQKAHGIAIQTFHSSAKKQILLHQEYYNYDSLMHMEKDSQGRIMLMMPDTMKINLLIADITTEVEKELRNINQEQLSIPLGILSGSKILASLGPQVKIDISMAGVLNVDIKDDFIAAGLNQTRHRLWLEISSDLYLNIPFEQKAVPVKTKILLCEGIIIGPIPDTYLNFGTGNISH
ncbi:MAG: sporulation protein YunB [Clostridiales bacterium]